MRSRICSALLVAGVAGFASFPALAQTAFSDAATPRITVPVDDQSRVTLRGNTPARLANAQDLGAMASSLPAGHLQLVLRRSTAQAEALRVYLGGLQNPHAANYRKWLTPAQYGAQFGLDDQDMQTVERWLQSEGLTVESIPAGRNFIRFSGTVGQVEDAFRIGIHAYRTSDGNGNMVERHGNVNDPSIPAALSNVVAGIAPLNDLHAHGQSFGNTRVQAQRGANGAVQLLSELPGGRPTPHASGLTVQQTLLMTPANAATVYDSPNKYNSKFPTGGTPYTGAGVIVGIAGYSDLKTADYANFRTVFLGETNPVPANSVVDGVDPGVEPQGDGQNTLEQAETLAGMAPGASLYVYSAQTTTLDDGLLDAAQRAINDNNVDILSVGYSICEYTLGVEVNATWNELWAQAAAQGISAVVAAGDTGAAGCDAGTEASAQDGLNVNGIASTPYDVAVGGTNFDTLTPNLAEYVNTADNAYSAPTTASVTGYIPENPWNDSIKNNPPGSYTTNIVNTYNLTDGMSTILQGTGGGVSAYTLCTQTDASNNCTHYSGYDLPPFQTGIPTPAGAATNSRLLPDVSMFAGSNLEYPAAWPVCSDSGTAQGTGTFIDCQPAADGSFTVEEAGGTEASASAFSGALAMLLQSQKQHVSGNMPYRIGNPNNVLYNLYANAGASGGAAFHDVTAGNNSVPCTAGSTDCGANGFLNGWDAGTGYDLATGLGSIDIAQLITAWQSVAFTPTSTAFTVNGGTTAISVTHGTPLTLAVAVTPASAGGSVSILGAGNIGASTSGNSGTGTVIPLGSDGTAAEKDIMLPGGTYNMYAYYPGDVNDAPSYSAPIQVMIAAEPSIVGLTSQVSDLVTGYSLGNTFPYGSYGFVYAKPSSESGAPDTLPSGTMFLLNNGQPAVNRPVTARGYAAFQVDMAAPGAYNLTANYSGDYSLAPGTTASSTALTIVQAPTTLTLATSETDVTFATPATVTVTLGTHSAGQFPSGNVTLTANGQSFAGTSVKGYTAKNVVQEIWTFTVPASGLVSGTNVVTATYPGDTNYLGSMAVISLNGPPTFTLATPDTGITLAATNGITSGTTTVALTSVGGFAGAVSLKCSLTGVATFNPPACSVAPSSVTLAADGTGTATVTVQFLKSGAAMDGNWRGLFEGGTGTALAIMLLWIRPSRRRRLLAAAAAVLAAVAVLGTSGCGVTRTAPLNGNYTATITGTSGSITQNAQFTVVVN